MLASNSVRLAVTVLDLSNLLGVLELRLLLLKTLTSMLVVSMLKAAMLHGRHLVRVLFREHFTVLDRLHRGVVVLLDMSTYTSEKTGCRLPRSQVESTHILVNFTINRCLCHVVLGSGNLLILHRGVGCLMDGSILKAVRVVRE